MNALEILKEKLVGNFYIKFSIGDIFELYFHDFHLVAQNIAANEEQILNSIFYKNFTWAKNAVDREDISKSTIICGTQRSIVEEVHIAKNQELQLLFENGVTLNFTTDKEIVDWQWALNNEGGCPYMDLIVGCIWADEELQIGNGYKKKL